LSPISAARWVETHDIGEEDRSQDPIGLDLVATPRQELLDLVEDGVGIPDPGQVVITRKLDELRPGDVLGEVAPRFHRDGLITGSVQHQCWNAARGQDWTHVDLGVHPDEGEHRRRARAHTQVARPGRAEALVRRTARRANVESDGTAPVLRDLVEEGIEASARVAPFVPVPHELASEAAKQDDRGGACRVRGSEQDTQRRAL
jgi:hypothetical protein